MKDKFILYRDPEDILFAFEKKEEFMYPHLFIEANDIKDNLQMNCNAVYVLFESKAHYPNTPLYIGKSSKVRDRLLYHLKGYEPRTRYYANRGLINFVLIYFEVGKYTSDHTNLIETQLIKEYKPLLNTQYIKPFQEKRMRMNRFV
ncbi:GIY-YIG nuclease family protein [Bacillus wiedmannii]|uniref:GIY-YIG nuclease family protein n=1 Tax=Bacillus wiedmannii TaxID=1890302 RepID=UPI002E1E8468|nr:GIY-YIG nuclease family protein [Bacillus wiedmannii]